eukprot:g29825.t1
MTPIPQETLVPLPFDTAKTPRSGSTITKSPHPGSATAKSPGCEPTTTRSLRSEDCQHQESRLQADCHQEHRIQTPPPQPGVSTLGTIKSLGNAPPPGVLIHDADAAATAQ